MLKRKKTTITTISEDNPYGISVGDLMAGLLLIFILILSSVMLRLEGLIAKKKTQLEVISEQELLKKSIISKLMEELSEYEVEIDPQTGVIRVKEGVLFEFGKHNVTKDGKEFLRKFIPKYSGILLRDDAVRLQLAQIIIEGHTDNVGTYQYNLELSLRRANSVAADIFTDEFGDFPFKGVLQQLLSANGRSFVEPRASNETPEGRAQNRRVEFKFRLKDWDLIEPLRRQFEEGDNP